MGETPANWSLEKVIYICVYMYVYIHIHTYIFYFYLFLFNRSPSKCYLIFLCGPQFCLPKYIYIYMYVYIYIYIVIEHLCWKALEAML